MPTRDPHLVLGVERGASQATIKAAWRRLARENHPDVIGSDPATARAATRRMAAINTAYEALRDRPARSADREPDGAGGRPGRRRGGPPPPRPTRPVTGRVNTADTFRARNRTTTGGSRGAHARSQPPQRPSTEDREPPRASDPSGPLRRSTRHDFTPPEPPDLVAASAIELDFGKFRGHSLGQVAAFEPSYIDWIASTITRDAGLVAAARAIRADLDRRGIVRRIRETERQQRDRIRQQREWRRILAEEAAAVAGAEAAEG
jgi:curved DNA-binding protein CbpA